MTEERLPLQLPDERPLAKGKQGVAHVQLLSQVSLLLLPLELPAPPRPRKAQNQFPRGDEAGQRTIRLPLQRLHRRVRRGKRMCLWLSQLIGVRWGRRQGKASLLHSRQMRVNHSLLCRHGQVPERPPRGVREVPPRDEVKLMEICSDYSKAGYS
jgi:hypothetical protein